jgi:hypothetical protein
MHVDELQDRMRVFSGVELYICCWKLEENAWKGIIYRKDEDFETF